MFFILVFRKKGANFPGWTLLGALRGAGVGTVTNRHVTGRVAALKKKILFFPRFQLAESQRKGGEELYGTEVDALALVKGLARYCHRGSPDQDGADTGQSWPQSLTLFSVHACTLHLSQPSEPFQCLGSSIFPGKNLI